MVTNQNNPKLFLFFFLFLIQFSLIKLVDIYGKYPTSYSLPNGKIIIVSDNETNLYSQDLQTHKNIIKFPENLKITSKEEAGKTTIVQYKNNINTILALIKNQLYFISENGDCINQFNLSTYLNGDYYSLIPVKYENNNYYYIITFRDLSTHSLSLNYFKTNLNDATPNAERIAQLSYKPICSEGYEKEIDVGSSCNLMKNSQNSEVLTCFYQISYPNEISTTQFTFTESTFTPITNIQKIYNSDEGCSILKTSISNDQKTAFICYIKYYQDGRCFFYDINNNNFTEDKKYRSSCKGEATAVRTYLYDNNFVFSCNDQTGFKIVLFDENNLEMINENDINVLDVTTQCYNVESFSVIYYNGEYNIIHGCDSSRGYTIDKLNVDIKYNFEKIIEEEIQEEEKIEKIELEEKIEYEEKEIFVEKVENEEFLEYEEKIENSEYEEKIEIEEKMEKIENEELLEYEEKIEYEEYEEKVESLFEENEEEVENEVYTNKTLEEISKELDQIMKNIDKSKNHLIHGDDYTLIIITPLDDEIEESTVHIDFSECEKELRSYYKIPDSEKLSLMQININNQNENRLNDQVEYKIYNSNGDPLDLSICKNVNIKIIYDIKNSSLLNLSLISDFKNMGVDILNIKDNFFNDICYPYSDNSSNNDMILSDRVSDIYQNLSLCDSGCEYENFNMEKMQITCDCKVKTEISTVKEDSNFATSITSAFFDSNFGVIKCYNLVFSLKGKLKNISFWIFLVLILLHIPIYIYYFKISVKPIKEYIKDEMEKKNYIKKNKNEKIVKKKTTLDENNDIINNNENNIETYDRKKFSDHIRLNSIEPLKSPTHHHNPPLKIKKNKSSNSSFSKNKEDEKSERKKKKKAGKLKVIIINGESNPSSLDGYDFNFSSSSDKKNEVIEMPNFDLKSPRKKNQMKIQNFIQDNESKNASIISPSPLNTNEEKFIRKEKRNNSNKTQNKINFNTKNILDINESNNESNHQTPRKKKIKNLLKSKLQNSHNLKKKHKRISVTIGRISSSYFRELKINDIENESQNISKNEKENKKENKTKIISYKKNNKNKKYKKINEFNLIRISADNKGNHDPIESKYILDNYTYKETKKYEKRNFCRIFFICLLAKENILNTFYYKPPLELQPLRYCVFIFNYTCDLALNALFYLTDNISDKYHYTGKYVHLYSMANNFTISLVSTIVSLILIYFFNTLTNSADKIQDIFKDEDDKLLNDKKYQVKDKKKNEIKAEIKKIMKCLKIKIIIFIISEFFIILFFWYYVTAFCHVYRSTQSSWLLDCVTSFFTSILIEIAISFILAVLYKVSVIYRLKFLYDVCLFFYGNF